MEKAREKIVDAAMALPASERASVVQELLDSLGPGAETLVDEAWARELDRRLAEYESGNAGVVPWSTLKAEE